MTIKEIVRIAKTHGLSREPSSDELEAARQREELAHEAYFQEIAEEMKKPKKGGKKRGL